MTPSDNRSLWQQPNFMKLWIGQTFSSFGSQITLLALPLLAALLFDATPFQMGLLTAAGTLPILLFGLIAGAWIDRLRRRPILVAADFIRMGLLLVLPVALAGGWLRIEWLYVVAFGVGTFSVFFGVAYQSYLPGLIGRSKLVDGNSRLEFSYSAARVTGPWLAGVIIDIFSAGFAIIIDSLTFLISGILIASIRDDEPLPARSAEAAESSILSDIADGLQFVLHNPLLRAIAGCTATANFFRQLLMAVFILYLVNILELSSVQIGLVFAGGNIGFLLGALLTQHISRQFGIKRTLLVGPVIASVGAVILLFSQQPPVLAIVILIGSQFFSGFGAIIYSITQLSLRQSITPDDKQGRMHATMRFLVLGAQPLGALCGGLIGEVYGIQVTLIVAVCGLLLPVVWLWFSPLRRVPATMTLNEFETRKAV